MYATKSNPDMTSKQNQSSAMISTKLAHFFIKIQKMPDPQNQHKLNPIHPNQQAKVRAP
jgi:hypothetical protein